jgi:hypothetical protein
VKMVAAPAMAESATQEQDIRLVSASAMAKSAAATPARM